MPASAGQDVGNRNKFQTMQEAVTTSAQIPQVVNFQDRGVLNSLKQVPDHAGGGYD